MSGQKSGPAGRVRVRVRARTRRRSSRLLALALASLSLSLSLMGVGGLSPAEAAATLVAASDATPGLTPAPAGVPATPPPAAGGLNEPAPRPAAEIRVQNRFARNLSTLQLFGGVDYLERRDFYLSPGVRLGGTYFAWESIGVELQVSHYFSRLNQAGQEVQHMSGVVPDSRAPTWLVVGGARYSMGYGKMMLTGLGRPIHFQPQALLQAGFHLHDGSFGPSALAGLGLLIHATPRWFFRLDGGMTAEVERRSTGTVMVLGFLPSLVTGGFF